MLFNTEKKSKATVKQATFSMSEKTIVQLNELSQKTGLKKSEILRQLIDHQFIETCVSGK